MGRGEAPFAHMRLPCPNRGGIRAAASRFAKHLSPIPNQTYLHAGSCVLEVIPVIDLMDGTVVRARMGRRDQYRPIDTPLSPTSDPVDVVRGLLTLHPFATIYVADLDGIQGGRDDRAVLRRLTDAFPQVSLWVDN